MSAIAAAGAELKSIEDGLLGFWEYSALPTVLAGMSLAAEFERLAEDGSETPRAALIDLTHGTLRRYGRVQAIVRQLPTPAAMQ